MYLSRIELDTKLHSTRRAIASPQIMHAAIENCFSDTDGEKERKLWRLDNLRDNHYILLLSHREPDFAYFSKQFSAMGVQGETKNYDVLLDRIIVGQTWRFRLKGNATRSVVENKGERGKVCAHVTVEHQRSWLQKKSQSCGFVLKEHMFDVTQREQLRFWRDGKKPPVTLGTAVFEGALEVCDIDLFRNSLTRGIGRAKAYGCGLLTIAGQQ